MAERNPAIFAGRTTVAGVKYVILRDAAANWLTASLLA
jgi:hypothetical protein